MGMVTPALHVVVLAAGKGTRLKSALPKVLMPLFGRPLLGWVLGAAATLRPSSIQVIVGHQREVVQDYLASQPETGPFAVHTLYQDPPLGTGHAVQQVIPQKLTGTVLVLAGDVPLIQPETLQALVTTHAQHQAALTLLGARVADPTGYGRLVLDAHGHLLDIVEQADATEQQRAENAVNAGVMALDWERVVPYLQRLQPQNAQQEYYLTDLPKLLAADGHPSAVAWLEDAAEMTGVNTRAQLADCHQWLHRQTVARLQAEGVTVLAPETCWFSPQVQVGPDTVIYPGCTLEGPVTVGKGCVIGPHTTLRGTSSVGDRSQVLQSWLVDSRVGDDNLVGPFAHLRDGSAIDRNIKVGNFVELKNAHVGSDSFVSHLAYVGDATLGRDVNFGAGAITANYNHITKEKHRTEIGDSVSVGANSVLIAPIAVGDGAAVAAGSVVSKPVAAGDLAIARVRQTTLKGWAANKQRQPVASE